MVKDIISFSCIKKEKKNRRHATGKLLSQEKTRKHINVIQTTPLVFYILQPKEFHLTYYILQEIIWELY